jgi:amino acid adenylation domain-containing protein
MTAHHIVCDGWSWGVLTEDLGALYNEAVGGAPGPAAADDYADYLVWQAQELSGPALAGHEQYWVNRFSGKVLPVLDLPTDRPRAAVRSFSSRRVDHLLDAALVTRLESRASGWGLSLFAVLLGAFTGTLHRLTDQDDLVVGVPSAGQSASGLGRLVGHCVNLLPLWVRANREQPFQDLAQSCSAALLDALEHQALSYGALLSRLSLHRDPSRLPLVSVMFNVDPTPSRQHDLFSGLACEVRTPARDFENFELFVNASRTPDGGIRLESQFNADLFDAATIERWMRCYETLLGSVAADDGRPLSRLDCLHSTDLSALKALQPAPVTFPGPALMHAAFSRQAATVPQRVALGDGRSHWTYQALDERSNRLAHRLQERGLGRGDRVGLCLNRHADMVVALLAVLKSGAAYVPLDPGFPTARLAYYAADAQLALLLTESGIASAPTEWREDAATRVMMLDRDVDWDKASPAPLPEQAHPEDLAYVIYTSGSTGKPKGVCVPHRAVANFLVSMQQTPGLGPEDRLAAVTTLSFDIAVLELMLPLSVGAQVMLIPRETALDGIRLAALLRESGATAMQATPGLWRMLLDAGWKGGAQFKALVGGEALPADLARDLLAHHGEVWNLYGPTETTVWSSVWRVDAETLGRHGVSIGRAIDNTTIWVLDGEGQPCPAGVSGEIHIGGQGLATGYLGRPDLTAERFVADRFAGTSGPLLYRTGDRGRWRNDGLLEHQGRLDSQVKLRGYRIELGEVEACCRTFPDVADCVAVVREDQAGDPRLVTYLVLAGDSQVAEQDLQRDILQHLRMQLPDYMLPQHVLTVQALPRLPNGKLDRSALPVPGTTVSADKPPRIAPRNDLERSIATAMETVLKLPGLSVDDDFFALGGHSLLAARLATLLNAELGTRMSLRTLLETPTIARLAAHVGGSTHQSLPSLGIGLELDPTQRSAPLTPMQERVRFMAELYPDSAAYNTPSAHALSGPLDLAALRRAFSAMVQRQPALRTHVAVTEAGGFEQRAVDELSAELPLIEAADDADLQARIDALARRPIDLYTAPLFHAALFRVRPDEHVLVFVPHHLIWDGWSFDVFYAEMSALYMAEIGEAALTLPPPGASPLDYARSYMRWLKGAEAAAELVYWRLRFGRLGQARALPTDRPRRVGGMSGRGGAEDLLLEASTVRRLRARAQAEGCSVSMLTLAVLAVLLASVAQSQTLVLGVPVRGREDAGLEGVMGYFNNLLALPVEVDPAWKFSELLQAVKLEFAAATSNQRIPFEEVSALPEVIAKASAAGLYQATYSFQDMRERCTSWGPLRHRRVSLFQGSVTEEFGLWLADLGEQIGGGIVFNADLYTPATAHALGRRYVELLDQVLDHADPDLRSLLAPSATPAALHLAALRDGGLVGGTPAKARAHAGIGRVADAAALKPAEEALARVWATNLNIDIALIRAGDNFFDLGGDSFLAMRTVEAAMVQLGVRVDARRYIYETLAQIAGSRVGPPTTQDANVGQAASAAVGLLGRMRAALGRGKP